MKTLQSEIMKALEDAKCLDPKSPNWSYHTASRIAAEVASQFREPSSPNKIDEAISYFEEIKSERESKKEDDTVLINYVLIILKSIKQRSPTVKELEDLDATPRSKSYNNIREALKESDTGAQEELPKDFIQWMKDERNILINNASLMGGDPDNREKFSYVAECFRIVTEYTEQFFTRKPLDR